MSTESTLDYLAKLEHTIRHIGNNSRYLMLEPIDPDLLQELNYLRHLSEPESEEVVLPEPVNRRKFERSGQTEEGSPETENLDPYSSLPPLSEQHHKESLDPLEAANLDSMRLRLMNCSRCQLCTGRQTVVFGQGNQNSKLVFIGEAPGEEEDRKGVAFVGKAGRLLTQIIHSIGLNRQSVYICNVIKCRPPGNRNPAGEEIEACYPFLMKQLDLLNPKLIVTMGNVATKALIPHAAGIMKMRGKLIDFNGIPLLPTFHPSFLLRNQSSLVDVWNDMRQIRQFLHHNVFTDS